jgi:hypothetical protein
LTPPAVVMAQLKAPLASIALTPLMIVSPK